MPALGVWLCVHVLAAALWPAGGGALRAQEGTAIREDTHPLLPGVRCAGALRSDWRRTLHDEQLTGFSPLSCGMKTAPRVTHRMSFGGALQGIRVVRGKDGSERLLVSDGRLRLVTADGNVAWTAEEAGTLEFFGDLEASGRDTVLLSSGRRLLLLDAADGRVLWRNDFQPQHVTLRVAVADALPERRGLEAAVFLHGSGEGFLLGFAPGAPPEVLWKRTVVVPGEWPEEQDHGTDVAFDLSTAGAPLIWNVRHHRIRSFDAETGERRGSLVYTIDGEQQRNYGPWAVGRDREGSTVVAVVSSTVQVHAHGARVSGDGALELAWQRDYGYVFENPEVRVKPIVLDDVDGDGALEAVYSVRDPAREHRSLLRVRDAGSGEIEAELADLWCVGASFHPSQEERWIFHAFPAPGGTTPAQGDLGSYALKDGAFAQLASFEDVRPAKSLFLGGTGAVKLPESELDLYLERVGEGGDALTRYTFRGGAAVVVSSLRGATRLPSDIVAACRQRSGEEALLTRSAAGILEAWSWSGTRLWQLDLAGGERPRLSAADLDGDGRAELVAAAGGERVHVLAVEEGGDFKERFVREFRGRDPRRLQTPLLYPLLGETPEEDPLCLVAPGSRRDGKLAVRAYRGDGALLWESALATTTDEGGAVVAWNAGTFLPGGRPAVAISVEKNNYTGEGTYLLDGASGEILWRRTIHGTGVTARPYRPRALPLAFDFDGDGAEDIGMDMYSYMAFLRGVDGSFVFLRHTRNIRAEGALAVGHLHHSFVPLYGANDTRPHWLVPLGSYGPLGLMAPHPEESGPGKALWIDELDAAIPAKTGIVDVDGDGRLEVGYAPRGQRLFLCRDAFTGVLEWELELETPVAGPVISADIDGDGKGEFLAGRYAIGTSAAGRGEVRWQAPVALDGAIIADFDGDGDGDIACPAPGEVLILSAR